MAAVACKMQNGIMHNYFGIGFAAPPFRFPCNLIGGG